MARHDSRGFVAGVLVGGLVGAALALLATPRGGRLAREAVGSLAMENADTLLERGREALRARFQQAAIEAQQAASETERRLEAEYRGARDGG